MGGDQPRGTQPLGRAGAPPSGPRSGRPPRLSGPRQARASCPSGRINRGGQWLDGSGRLVVWVAFERVELDAVQLLEALPAALAREVVLHLGRVLLHVPVERRALSALVATDLAPAGSRRATPGAGSDWGGAALGAGPKLRGTRGVDPPSAGPGPHPPPSQPPRGEACHSLQGRLAGVRASVYLQVVLPLEGLAAGFAGEFTDTWGRCGAERPGVGGRGCGMSLLRGRNRVSGAVSRTSGRRDSRSHSLTASGSHCWL